MINLSREYVSIMAMKFTGKIIKGDSRGKKIGFPTINLNVFELPVGHGVYVVKVGELPALMHYGPVPTFGNHSSRVEIHILDFDDDIYGREVEVEIFNKVRGVQKFKSAEDLVERIKEDIRLAREFFAV